VYVFWRLSLRVLTAQAYDEATDVAHSSFNFNFDRRYIYISIRSATHINIPSGMMPFLAEIPFDDIITRGVQCYGEHIPNERIRFALTVTTRRPPRFYVQVPDEYGTLRRATEMDFVNARGPMQSTAVSDLQPMARADDQGRSLAEMKAKGFIIHEGHAGPIAVVPDDLSMRVGFFHCFQLTHRSTHG
jgi:hypothetical protein